MTTLEINTMPVEERLILMEDIWNSFHTSEDDIASPQWHQEVVQERQESLRSGNAKLFTIDELRNR